AVRQWVLIYSAQGSFKALKILSLLNGIRPNSLDFKRHTPRARVRSGSDLPIEFGVGHLGRPLQPRHNRLLGMAVRGGDGGERIRIAFVEQLSVHLRNSRGKGNSSSSAAACSRTPRYFPS